MGLLSCYATPPHQDVCGRAARVHQIQKRREYACPKRPMLQCNPDLSARTPGFSEGEGLKRRGQVSKVPSEVWCKPGRLEVVYRKLLEVRDRREVTQDGPVESVGTKIATLHADPDVG